MKTAALLALICLTLIPIGCSKQVEQKGINLSVKMTPERLSDNLFVKMDYTAELTPEFSQTKDDLSLFVHFWRKKTKEMLVQDDHSPEKPTSQWKKGEKLTYSRTLFIPQFFNEYAFDFKKEETIRLTIGLINPKNPDQKSILLQKDLNIESAAYIAPGILYYNGWHQPEINAKADTPEESSWRWTTQKAVCIIENPKKTYDLRIRGGVSKNHFSDQSVIIKLNDTVLDQFIPETAKFNKLYTLTSEQLGELDEIQITIETDKVFIPSQVNPNSKDDRELGIQIYLPIYFRESIQ